MQVAKNLERVSRVVSKALALDWEARLPFLERVCGEDLHLRQELSSLLAEERALYDGFLETPPARVFSCHSLL